MEDKKKPCVVVWCCSMALKAGHSTNDITGRDVAVLILKIPWTTKLTSDEVLKKVNREREHFTTIKKRRRHIMRNEKHQLMIQVKWTVGEELDVKICLGFETLGSGYTISDTHDQKQRLNGKYDR